MHGMNSGGTEAILILIFVLLGVLIAVAIVAFMIFCWWRVFSKAGYSGALSLLLLVPFGNLIVLLWLAFGNWPVLDELRSFRRQGRMPAP